MSFSQEGDYSSFSKLSAQWSISKQSAVVMDINQTKDTRPELHTPVKNESSPSFHHIIPQLTPHTRRANATLVMLARNSDLNGVISSVEQLEAKFNRNFNYPWVFLNDEPFSVDFKRYIISQH